MNKIIIVIVMLVVLNGCSSYESCYDNCLDIKYDEFKTITKTRCNNLLWKLFDEPCDPYNYQALDYNALENYCHNDCKLNE